MFLARGVLSQDGRMEKGMIGSEGYGRPRTIGPKAYRAPGSL